MYSKWPTAFVGAVIALFGCCASAANTAPGELMVREPIYANEGEMFTVEGSFADPDTNDAHTVRIFWEGGVSSLVQLPAGVRTFTASHVYYYDSFVPVYPLVVVEDDQGGSVSGSFAVTVLNVAPTIQSIVMSTNACDEGDTVALEVQFSDPGLHDYHRVEIGWGDLLDRFDAQGRYFFRDHAFFDDTIFGTAEPISEVTITLWDEFDYHTVRTNILVRNVPPSVPVLALSTNRVAENNAVTLSGVFEERGAFDQHAVAIDWGDGTPVEIVDAGWSRAFALSHMYADDPGGESDEYRILVTVTDDDEGSNSSGASVTVTNIAPSLSDVQIAARVPARSMGVLRGKIADPCPMEALSLEVNWGDGSERQNVSLPAGASNFALPHVFRTGGPRCNVQVTLRDDDGGETSGRAGVEIVDGSAMPPCPPVLRMVRRGLEQIVEWDVPGVVLQSAPAMEGPWTDIIPAATSPFTVPPQLRGFFRARP